MGPRKKAKRAHSSTPQAEAVQSAANTPGSTASAEQEGYDYLADPWTDEQETALLKAIIKWKPVGMHKHFRMIAIADYLHSQGFGPSTGEHMQIPGIWKKLGTLYNLEALDEREDSIFADSNDNEDEDGESERYCPFELSHEEYGDLMFERRLAEEGSSSPISSIRGDSLNGSTAGDTDGLSEPASSPAPSRGGRKSNRGTRKRATRSTKLQVEIETDKEKEGSDEDAGSGEDTGGNEEEDEGDEGSDGEESEAEEAEEEKGGSRSTRASRSKQNDKKPPTSTGTRRTGRRR